MIKAEWKSIFNKKLLIIVLCVMCFIPSIYTVTFLGSMWDPYGKMEKLPVAVINHDKPVKMNGKKMAIGDEMEKNMRKDGKLDFRFPTEAKAAAGLKSGKYFMVITIPKDFSKNATTLLKDDPKKMTINYQTMAGHNFTASKFMGNAVTALKDSIASQVTEIYATSVFGQFKEAGSSFTKAGKANKTLADGSGKIQSGNAALTANLQKLADSTLTFQQGTAKLERGFVLYQDGVGKVAKGSSTLASGTKQLASQTAPLAQGVDALAGGADELATGTTQFVSGVKTVGSGMDQLNNGLMQLNTGMPQMEKQSSHLENGIAKLQTGSSQLENAVSSLNTKLTSKEAKAQTARLSEGLEQLKQGMTALTKAKIPALTNTLQTLNEQIATSQESIQSAVQTSDKEQTTLQEIDNLLADKSDLDADGMQALKAKLAVLKKQQGTTNQSVHQLQTNISTTKLTEQVRDVAQTAAALQAGYAGTDTQPGIYGGTKQLLTANQQIASAIGGSGKSILTGAAQLNQGLETTHSAVKQANQQLPKLTSSVSQLESSSSKLAQGNRTLVAKSGALQNGASGLDNGLTTLNAKVPLLTNGTAQLATGAANLQTGLATLQAKGSTLTAGVNQLDNGATGIHHGSEQLAEGSSKIEKNMTKIVDGNQQLATNLQTGGEKINQLHPTDKTYQMMAKPVKTKHEELAKVVNNGTGMAPYMMSLALFVGGITLNMMYNIYSPKQYPRYGVSWWASKMSVLGAVGILQALLMVIFLTFVNGLEPVAILQTFGVLVATSLMFMAIICFFNLALGKAGSFLMLIFLILQLGGSGGTYPVQLSNGFFQAIHPFLPMTYSVDALRNTLSIGGSIQSGLFIIITLAIVFNLLIILFFRGQRKKISQEEAVA